MLRRMRPFSVVVMVVGTLAVAGPASAATGSATIDFESGLAPGDLVSSLSVGSGISGMDAGVVGVVGAATGKAGNRAMIFDATCGGAPATCSGGDSDLYQPANGHVLINSEDLDSSDPDDVGSRQSWTFDFSGWGPGIVTVVSVDILDVETNELPSPISIGGTTVFAPATGNGGVTTVPVNGTGDVLRVETGGTSAVDNIVIRWEMRGGGEGCTPGYWRQTHHFDSWTGYAPGDSFDAVFGVSYGGTLLEAVWARGGGEHALARHAVAALLNASSSVDYLYSEAEVIALVQDAFADGGRSALNAAKDRLETQNEMGCPLN